MWKQSWLLELPGIDTPILQAPMAGSADSSMAIAVGKAGAIGALPCALFSPQQIESQFKRIRESSNSAINVNFFCHKAKDTSSQEQNHWRSQLQRFCN